MSWWSWQPVINLLNDRFHIVTPILNGHGDNWDQPFTTIEENAIELINYIKKDLQGKVYAIAGLSIGGQILCELLSREPSMTEKAIIESPLLYPIKGTKSLTVPMVSMTYPLIRYRWFAKLQAAALSLPKSMFEDYYQDSLKISKTSLINITLSNGTYHLKPSIKHTTADIQRLLLNTFESKQLDAGVNHALSLFQQCFSFI